MPPRARKAPTGHYEEVVVAGERCLRIAATGKPVAWSKKDDAAWRSYVAEAQAAVSQKILPDEG